MKRLFLILIMAAAACAAADAYRIALLSDVHVTPGNRADTMLRRAVDEINAADYDLVIMNGDLTNEGSDAELRRVKDILDGIRHPLSVLPGNHESTWSQSATKTFFDLWGTDRFAVETDSLLITGIACGPYMKMGDGHVKQEDLHWLSATLAASRAPRVLSVNHYPILPDLDNDDDYARVLAPYPVIGHINGHYHQWRSYEAGGYLPGVMTRALLMPDGTAGYAIVDISPDWVHVYEKILDREPRAKYAFAAEPRRAPEALTAAPADTAVAAPAGWQVRRVWADSASVFTRPAFDARHVYIGNSLGHAIAIDKTTGRRSWSIPTGASLFSRPAVLRSGRVAFPTATGILTVDADGRRARTEPSPEGPYVADGLVLDDVWVQGGYKRLELRDPRSGRLRHTYDSLYNYCQAAPAVDGSDIIFGAWDTNLRCIDRRTGRLRWVWNNGKAQNQLGPGNVVPVITPERVYIVAPDRYMTAIDRRTGATIWRDKSHRYRESLGHSTDHRMVYAKTMDGELVAVDATVPEFREAWTVDLGLGYDHAPCIVAEHDGVVLAGSRRGILTAVDPASRQVLWSLPLGKSEINGIDIDPSTGHIWVTLIEGTVYEIVKS
ncbi:MAG: PQQ-binding-like beta-propeller repeat protein [Bacteroides sp.]|nr:PQQ-binding-like beta-propeller repeat protein [Bacteroides sp.]MCM1095112.1 PQQ-binding-like beta-propeller repeat protein [Terasakiella sp.]